MAKIHEVTRFSGRAQVLGRTCEFTFDNDALMIGGLAYEDVHLILDLLQEHPGRRAEMDRLLATSAAGRTPVQKPATSAEPTARQSAVVVHQQVEGTPEAIKEAVTTAAESAAPAMNGAAHAAPATAPAAEEPKGRRGRQGKPKAPEPNPAALDKILSRVGGVPAAAEGTSAQAAPAEPTPAPAGKPKRAPAPAPKEEPEDDEDLDDEEDDEDLDDEEDDDDDPIEDDLDGDDDVEPEQAAPPPARARRAEAPAASKQQEKLNAAEKRAETGEKLKGRSLVDDAEEEAAPRAAAAPAAEPKAAPAQKPTSNGARKYLLDPKNLPKEVYEAKTMRALISYFAKNGVRTVEDIMAECERIRDQSTMLKAVPDLRSRIESALELMPPQATA